MKASFLKATISWIAITTACPALAQTVESQEARAAGQSTADDRSDAIIVTAQRREQNLQSTALAIEAVSGESLARAGVANADQLTNQFSGVQIGGGSTPQIYVRGVGDFGVLPSANPAVVTSLDGVAISRPQAIGGNFFDLERIELLKGPQGTLYGRNASGGALNLISAKPRLGETSGYIQFDIGNYDYYSGEAALNLPLGQSTAMRLSAQVTDRDGYLSDGTGDDVHQSLRLQTYSEFGDAVDLRLQGTYTNFGGKGTGIALISPLGDLDPWTGTGSPESAQVFFNQALANFVASGGNSPPPAILDAPDPANQFQDIESWSVSAELNVDIGGPVLTIIPAYRETEYQFGSYPSFLYSPGFGPSDGESADQLSLEVRLAGSAGPVDWLVGGYGFKEDQRSSYVVNSGLIQRILIGSNFETEALAAFTEMTLNVSDNLRVIGGIRFTTDQRSQLNVRRFAISPTIIDTDRTDGVNGDDPCAPPLAAPGTTCDLNLGIPPEALNSAETFEKVTWKVGVEADVFTDSLLFANVTTGFKAGGFNIGIDPATLTNTLAFDPESITAYTLGLKNEFVNGAVRLNLEAFYWDYSDLQLSQLVLDGIGQVTLSTVNAGKAEIMGGRVEMFVEPWAGTTLQFGVEYVDTQYKEFVVTQPGALVAPGSTACAVSPSSLPPGPAGPFVDTDCSGFQLVRSPTWSGTFGVQHEFDLHGAGFILADFNGAFASSRYVDSSFISAALVDGYLNLSASLEYTPADERWFARAWVRNITNETVYTGGGGGQSPFVAGFITGSINPPRTYGLTIGARFD